KTVTQLQAEPIPDDHPMVEQLNEIFGDHTYFVDGNGLNIVEPAAKAMDTKILEPSAMDARGMGVVVNLANWTDSDPPKLQVHEPELTESMVALETNGGS